MVRQEMGNGLVYGIKMSSVGPATVTGDVVYEPSNMDLAMKLHYLRLVYFFNSLAAEGITVPILKESLFRWLDYYFEICGRLRRSETTGRPFIKCNDSGVRIIEAKSSKSVDEWVEMKDDASALRLLVPDQVIGPELIFSPLVLFQWTSLKCGGISVGLSWAHVLGDAFSLSESMNRWARILAGINPTHRPNLSKCRPRIDDFPTSKAHTSGPLSLKEVEPVGDHWITATTTMMATWSFLVSSIQLSQLQTGQSGSDPIPPFESICAVIWRAAAKVRNGRQPQTVTVIRKGDRKRKIYQDGGREEDVLSNSQVVNAVKAEFPIAEASLEDLAALIRDQAIDERAQISETVRTNPGMGDFVVYGANLTFVNWEEATFYEIECKGIRPSLVNCFVDGIGEGGVILVLPGPDTGSGKNGDGDWLVTITMPEIEMTELKHELKKEFSLP